MSNVELKKWLVAVALLLSIGFVGCGGPSEPGAGQAGKTSTPAKSSGSEASPDSASKNPDLPALAWPGIWRIEMTDDGIVHQFGIISIQEADQPNRYDVKSQALSPSYDAAVLRDAKIEGDRIELIYDGGPELIFTFTGNREAKEVKGQVWIKKLHVSTIRLLKVESDILNEEEDGLPMEGFEVFAKIVGSTEGEDGLRDFIQQYPDNPIILRAYEVLSGYAKTRNAPKEEVEKLYQELMTQAKRWGDLIVARSNFEFARFLVRFDYFPELAEKYLAEFEKSFNDETPKSWIIDLAAVRVALGSHKEVVEQLTPLVAQDPGNYEAKYTLALAHDKNGDVDQALEGYMQLLVLPLMDQTLTTALKDSKPESLAASVSRLWTQKHGNANDLEKTLDEQFHKQISDMIPPREGQSQASEKSRTVLLELFTGTTCPPCVAADIASEGVRTRFPAPEVIVIRHHMHIPGPDPLAIEGGESRLQKYWSSDPFFQQHPEARGTPSLFANGTVVSGVGGAGVEPVPAAYERLMEALRPIIGDETDLKILVDATRDADKIKVNARVEGPELKPDWRLHLLLVENEIRLLAPNGIRVHDAVVRHDINGVAGTSSADNKLEFTGEIVLPEVASGIRKYISKMEEKVGQVFAVPPTLDKLQIVAYIQDQTTNEILQAKIVTPENAKP